MTDEREAKFAADSALLKQLATLQEECQQKARHYRANGPHDLAGKFHVANIAASNMRLHVAAALMAEREELARRGPWFEQPPNRDGTFNS